MTTIFMHIPFPQPLYLPLTISLYLLLPPISIKDEPAESDSDSSQHLFTSHKKNNLRSAANN